MTHSADFDHLKERWEQKRISISMLRKYVKGNRITPEEFTEITGEQYQGAQRVVVKATL